MTIRHPMIDPTVSAYYTGDVRALLKRLPDGCVQCCVTSPPFWGLRSYLDDDDPMKEFEIGLEATPEEYVAVMVEVFEEVRRVLRNDGVLWLNLGDSYSHGGCGARDEERWPKQSRNDHMPKHRKKRTGLKPKDLVGVPWMAAFALRNAGWYLRQDVIWAKPNPMPESVTDRCTKAHEYLFHFSKSASYYYDADAIAEPVSWGGQHRNVIGPDDSHMPGAPQHTGLRKYKSGNKERKQRSENGGNPSRNTNQTFGVPWEGDEDSTRNKRSVWTVTPQPYAGAHFATFPPDLIEPCILACSRPGDLVLDPFFGSGTTGEVAEKHERLWIGFDLNPKYAALAKERTAQRSLPLSR